MQGMGAALTHGHLNVLIEFFLGHTPNAQLLVLRMHEVKACHRPVHSFP